MLSSGFDLGVDFKGGRTYTVRFDQPVEAESVRTYLTNNFDNKIQVKSFSGNDKPKITTSYKIDETTLKQTAWLRWPVSETSPVSIQVM